VAIHRNRLFSDMNGVSPFLGSFLAGPLRLKILLGGRAICSPRAMSASTPPPEEHAPRLHFLTPRIHVATKPPALKRPIRVSRPTARPSNWSMGSATLHGAEQDMVEWARIILGLTDGERPLQNAASAPPSGISDAPAFQPGDIKENSTQSAVASLPSSSSPAPKNLMDADDLSRFPTPRKTCTSTVKARFAEPPPFLAHCKRQRVGDTFATPTRASGI
jgi:hypothetical protein